jgi:hypothetical protein
VDPIDKGTQTELALTLFFILARGFFVVVVGDWGGGLRGSSWETSQGSNCLVNGQVGIVLFRLQQNCSVEEGLASEAAETCGFTNAPLDTRRDVADMDLEGGRR